MPSGYRGRPHSELAFPSDVKPDPWRMDTAILPGASTCNLPRNWSPSCRHCSSSSCKTAWLCNLPVSGVRPVGSEAAPTVRRRGSADCLHRRRVCSTPKCGHTRTVLSSVDLVAQAMFSPRGVVAVGRKTAAKQKIRD